MSIFPAFRHLPAILRGWSIRGRKRGHPSEQEGIDVLTSLANRRRFLRVADDAIAEASRRSDLCAILVIDLDDFRSVNDKLGHAAGDAVLIAVAQRLGLDLPTTSVAGRLGDDEFAVLLGPDADLRIEYCAEQIGAHVARSVTYAGKEIVVAVNIGIAIAPDDGRSAAALIAAADARMSHCKRQRLEIADVA